MKFITRTQYLDRLIGLQNTKDIKIMTGIWRSGKSALMFSYIDCLKNHNENANIFYIDYMDSSFIKMKEYHVLHKYVEDQCIEKLVIGKWGTDYGRAYKK